MKLARVQGKQFSYYEGGDSATGKDAKGRAKNPNTLNPYDEAKELKEMLHSDAVRTKLAKRVVEKVLAKPVPEKGPASTSEAGKKKPKGGKPKK